jgi:SAM-dependent methyltransferase
MPIPKRYRTGEVLFGNDLDAEQMQAWYDDEKTGYAEIASHLAAGDGMEAYGYRVQTRIHGGPLRDRHYDTALVLGCANGLDILALGLSIGRIIAIEPAEKWHVDNLGGIPADYRVPPVDGTIDLPDGSVDLAVAIGVLHHIPNVEHVVAEMGRVLKPGGRLFIREPISSMQDWTVPRKGQTKNERGIAVPLMEGFIRGAGLTLERRAYAGTVLPQFLARRGGAPYNSQLVTRIDMVVSRLLAWNARYWRPRLIDKLAPTVAAWWAYKPPRIRVPAPLPVDPAALLAEPL